MKRLWYRQEANDFKEALPIGNGRLGAMIYGGAKKERISLNEDTLWSGYPKEKILPNAKEGIEKASSYMKSGKIKEAEKVLFENCLGDYTDSYLPAGNIWIDTEIDNISEYYRELNIENAVSMTCFRSNQYLYRRKAFATAADGIIVLNFESENKQAVTEISLDIPHPCKVEKVGKYLIAKAIAPYYCAPSYTSIENPVRYDSFESNRALSYAIVIRVDRECEIKNQKIIINSPNFNVYIDVQTNFEGFNKQPRESKIVPEMVAIKNIENALKKGYDAIEKDHIQDYRGLFDRVKFELEGVNKIELPTDERLKEYLLDKSDVGLHVLLFDYGRYLTIASSRENSQAANLQGIWNEEIRAPWSSNYTININTQMNYWHVEAANLSECHLPLLSLIKNMSEQGSEIASKHYGCRGWCSHHNTDLWASAGAITGDNVNAVQYGFWPMSGAWLCRHIWEHYEYTHDIDFLRNNWDIMKGAAQFLLDWFIEDEKGFLHAPISTSPENSYLLNGEKHYLAEGTAMDQAIACDIFTSCIKAAEIIKRDNDFLLELKGALKKLKMYEIGSKGQILEWDKERLEAEPTHRHLSLLYGIYPGNSILHIVDWMNAAQKTMELRGDEATGWSFGWKACVWARLKDGNRAKRFIDHILRLVNSQEVNYGEGGGVYMNLLCAHPPFQIDGNFGITAAMCEMLLQYDGDNPQYLPAIPKEWKHGRISGLVLKGGKETEISW